MHPFIDGNKRTALASLQQYPLNEKIIFVIPLSAVRFCIKVAENHDIFEEGNNNLIASIEKWIRFRSKPINNTSGIFKIIKYDISFLIKVKSLSRARKDKELMNNVIHFFLALDLYPDSKTDYNEILGFLKARYQLILNYLKNECNDSKNTRINIYVVLKIDLELGQRDIVQLPDLIINY